MGSQMFPFRPEDLSPPSSQSQEQQRPSAPSQSPGQNDSLVQQQLEQLAQQQLQFGQVLERVMQRIETPPVQPNTQPDTSVDPKTKWWTDPDKAVEAKIQPILDQVSNTGSMLVEQEIRRQYPHDFKHWADEIRSLIYALHPAIRANPQSWYMAIEQVRGRHVKEIMSNADFVSAFTEASPGVSASGSGQVPLQLTEAELKVAKSLGQTPESYAAAKKRMVIVSG